ncbi:MAG: ABC transporter permease [Dehalococcoidales bacterium]|nr:ABC transporter permease [Dehalococcoidales bacterium]
MRSSSANILISLWVLAFYVFLMVPILIIVAISFTSSYSVDFPPAGFSLRWFDYIMNRKEMVNAFWISVTIAAITSVVSLILGLLSSLAIVRFKFPGKSSLESLFMAPATLPTVILGVALLQFFSVAGVGDSFNRLVLGHVIIAIPFTLRSISASLYGFDRSLEEASLVLGSNHLKTFYKIVLPVIKPGIIVAVIFAFIASFDNFTISMFLINANTVTLPVRILTYLEWQFDPSVAAISTVLIALTFIVIMLLEKAVGLGNARMVRMS